MFPFSIASIGIGSSSSSSSSVSRSILSKFSGLGRRGAHSGRRACRVPTNKMADAFDSQKRGIDAVDKAQVMEKTNGGSDANKNKKFKSTRSDLDQAKIIDQAYRETFGPLQLEMISARDHIGKTKTRNHINPLSSQWQVPIDPPKWEEIFQDPKKPLWVDIGCAQGRFGLQMAVDEKWGTLCNHLGLEIREPHVKRANSWAKGKCLTNLHFLACNVNTSISVILESYPGTVHTIAVQFPDPQFKKKHHKRRVVTDEFLNMIAKQIPQGATWFVQSDVEEAAAQMRDRTDLNQYFSRIPEQKYTPRDEKLEINDCAKGVKDSIIWTKDGKRPTSDGQTPKDYGDWLIDPNPYFKTEREVQNIALGLPIYRAMFKRNDVKYDA